jgi:hypothetical protein
VKDDRERVEARVRIIVLDGIVRVGIAFGFHASSQKLDEGISRLAFIDEAKQKVFVRLLIPTSRWFSDFGRHGVEDACCESIGSVEDWVELCRIEDEESLSEESELATGW